MFVVFEFDEQKSRENKKKHGIDFVEAQIICTDMFYIQVPARSNDEPRFFVVGKIGEKHWTAVVTSRNENVRIMSVRRSRKEEVILYESDRI